MISRKQVEKIQFGGPCNYRIIVKGNPAQRDIDDLSGMGISITGLDVVSALTQLDGTISDQTALSGLLETLYEKHLAIVSVEVLAENNSTK